MSQEQGNTEFKKSDCTYWVWGGGVAIKGDWLAHDCGWCAGEDSWVFGICFPRDYSRAAPSLYADTFLWLFSV